jgi:hypothetical protein
MEARRRNPLRRYPTAVSSACGISDSPSPRRERCTALPSDPSADLGCATKLLEEMTELRYSRPSLRHPCPLAQ